MVPYCLLKKRPQISYPGSFHAKSNTSCGVFDVSYGLNYRQFGSKINEMLVMVVLSVALYNPIHKPDQI